MSSVGLNKWIASGHLAADAEIKTVDLKSGEKAKVAKATIYVRKPRSREDSLELLRESRREGKFKVDNCSNQVKA
jgi:hypothetical protein